MSDSAQSSTPVPASTSVPASAPASAPASTPASTPALGTTSVVPSVLVAGTPTVDDGSRVSTLSTAMLQLSMSDSQQILVQQVALRQQYGIQLAASFAQLPLEQQRQAVAFGQLPPEQQQLAWKAIEKVTSANTRKETDCLYNIKCKRSGCDFKHPAGYVAPAASGHAVEV